MSKPNLVLKIDKPHFRIELYENVLKIDLKENAKDEIKKEVEAKSQLGQILGRILNVFVPLHVRLSDIGCAEADSMGNVKIALPHHRDIVIPLEVRDATKLVEKMNELIPIEKEKELRRMMERHRLQRIEKGERMLAKEEEMTLGPAEMPMPEPRGVRRQEEEAEREVESHET